MKYSILHLRILSFVCDAVCAVKTRVTWKHQQLDVAL